MMKIALQLGLIPGREVEDKLVWARDHGVEGIEITAGNYPPDRLTEARRELENALVPVVSICGNPSFDFLDPDPVKREKSIGECLQYLDLAGDLGAVGQIVPPIFGGPRINDLSPYKSAVELEKELLVRLLNEDLGPAAEDAGTCLLLEPLNRYEQHLLRRQEDAVPILKRCEYDSVRLISDIFHMHIEETCMPETIRRVGDYIAHLHLADNTRLEPGSGDIDYVSIVEALLDIDFEGYMAYECGLSGEDPEEALLASLEYMRNCMDQARRSS